MKKLIFMSILLFTYLNGFSQPDLTVTSVGLNRSYVPCGILVRASAIVENAGDERTSTSSHLGYYLSTDTNWDTNDIFLKEDYVRTLNPGATSSEYDYPKIPTDIAEGIYYLLFVADHNEVIAESDENNNVAYREINVYTCEPLPDLVVTNETIVDRYVSCGETIEVSALVKNRDVATASPSRLGYYLSDDWHWNATGELLDSDPVGNLARDATSLETATLTIPANTPPGIHWILFRADYQGVVDERVETNNMEPQWISVSCNGQKQSTEGGMNVSNFPSPFSENTTIVFDLVEDGPVTVFVSDMTGKQVAVLLDKEQQYAGANQVIFDGSTYPSGTYYYTIQAGEYTATKKMVLMK